MQFKLRLSIPAYFIARINWKCSDITLTAVYIQKKNINIKSVGTLFTLALVASTDIYCRNSEFMQFVVSLFCF